MKKLVMMLLAACACLAAAACASPEARRGRGAPTGGDVGNRPAELLMHEGSDPFWRTPVRIKVAHPPLQPGRQALELSR